MSRLFALILILITAITSFAQTREFPLDDGWIAKRAVEVPVDGTVVSSSGFELYDIHGSSIEENSSKASVGANTYEVIRGLFSSGKPDGFYYARLRLEDSKGKLLDENLYWLTGDDADWLELESLRQGFRGKNGRLKSICCI